MIDWPSSPSVGQVFNSGTGPVYIWDGVAWTLQTVTTDPWSVYPIGVPIPLMTHKSAAEPPTTGLYRYVKLTAADAYNSGVLTSESVSGSAPAVIATAVISRAGSPMNGVTINLWNTERRYIRAGSPGTIEADAFRDHTHSIMYSNAGGAATTTFSRGNVENTGTYQPTIGANPAGTTETRVKSEGVNYYMRII